MKGKQMRIKGAIFDMDGVLFDTERIYQQTWQEIAAERHIKLGDGFLEAVSGTSGAHMCRVIEQYYGVSDGTAIIKECMERVRNKLLIHVPMKEGVPEMLRFLKEKGIRMAVASSSSVQQIEANIHKAGIHEYFAEIVSGSEVDHGKPNPDIFLYAAKRIGCDPEECFVFEDSENGVQAGYRAGCVTIMIPDMIKPSPEITQYCYKICSDFREVQKEIAGIL